MKKENLLIVWGSEVNARMNINAPHILMFEKTQLAPFNRKGWHGQTEIASFNEKDNPLVVFCAL